MSGSPTQAATPGKAPTMTSAELPTRITARRSLCCKQFAPREVFVDRRETYIKHSIVEFVMYIVFLSLLCFSVYAVRGSSVSHMSSMVHTLLVDGVVGFGSLGNNLDLVVIGDSDAPFRSFRNLVDIRDFWKFMLYVMTTEFTYATPASPSTRVDESALGYENLMLTPLRLRQLRVRSDSCTVRPDVKTIVKTCNDYYSPVAESKETYGGSTMTFSYSDDTGADEGWYTGQLASYPPGGFTITLPTDYKAFYDLCNLLHTNEYIDGSSRVLFLDVVTYNANVNLFAVLKFVLEFPPTGGVVSTPDMLVVNLLRYSTTIDLICAGCLVLSEVFICIFAIEQIVMLVNLRAAYFKLFWSYVELALIINGLVVVVLTLVSYLAVSAQLDSKLASRNQFVDYYALARKQHTADVAVAFMVFFAWVKLFKYFDFNQAMSYISTTLTQCTVDLIGFIVMFFMIFMAFAQFAYLIFGMYMDEFSTIEASMFSLFRIILGDFNVNLMRDANRVLGPLFFFLYVFFVFFVLLNMFLAIINQTYLNVKYQGAKHGKQLQLADYLRLIFCRPKAGDNMFAGWRMRMSGLGYESEDIDAIADQHRDEKPPITQELADQMTQELDELSKSPDSAAARRRNATLMLFQRLDNLELNLKSLDGEINTIMERYTEAENNVTRRTAAFSKLIEIILQTQKNDLKKLSQIGIAIKEELDRLDEQQ